MIRPQEDSAEDENLPFPISLPLCCTDGRMTEQAPFPSAGGSYCEGVCILVRINISHTALQDESSSVTPRLFECSNQTGRFIATEITHFNQDDLDEDDVMLLDIWDQVYLWIGKGANDKEKHEAVVTAQEYLKSHPAGRDLDTPILVVKQGFEPPTFTGWFHAWDPQKWSGGKSYDQLKSELGDATDLIKITVDLTKPTSNQTNSSNSTQGSMISRPVTQTFPPEKLVNVQTEDLPDGVDPTRKEDYLSNDDFALIMGISRMDFYAMPSWKQLNIKKEKGLF